MCGLGDHESGENHNIMAVEMEMCCQVLGNNMFSGKNGYKNT